MGKPSVAFLLVLTVEEKRTFAPLADGVDLVNEDNARRAAFRLAP